MDADVDSAWICTQAIVSTDSQLDDEHEKINNYGYIVLNDMIDNGRYILKEGDNTIGRHPLNHIYIEHPSVSMNHAVIQCDSDGVVLLDKGSLNKTKLNKKTLRKNVAYFLEENALLTFGEVQADYFMNEKSIEFENDTKSITPDNTYVLTATQNDGHSSSKLSNAIITPKYFRTDIPNAITDCNVSLIIENKSTCKIEKEVPKTITGTECTMNTHNDIHTKLNSSSPSDEYLLEALSQAEAKQNNENSNQIFHNLSSEDTLINLTKSVSEITREDTPSPVMDLKSSILTTNNILQSPSQINKELIREDTPSPIMDFGCCNDFEDNLETNNHGINSAIQSLNEVDNFNNTQVLEIDKNTVELNTHFSNNDDILFFEAQNVKSGEQSIISTKNLLDIHSNDRLSGSNNINLSTNGHNTDEHKIIVNTFEADDDDVFRHFIEEEFKSQQHDLATHENQDFFNCPTQKVSIKKNIQTKVTSLVHDKETQNLIKDLSKSIKNNESALKSIQEDLTEVLKIDDDFFNCPTQKLSTSKNIFPNIKICPSIHEEETLRPPELLQFDKTNNIVSNDYSTNKHKDLTEVPVMDDDFFNCPTQKVSITKKTIPKRELFSFIHDKATQELLEFSKPCKSNSIVSKSYSTSIREENTQKPNIDDDFFNCPTQKVSITRNLNANPKVSLSIHEEETQIPPEFSQFDKTNNIVTNDYSTNKHKDLTEVPEMDDDFFNCPTQKVSNTKKINPKSKLSSSIHNEKTKELLEFSKPCKSNSIVSKSCSTSIHEENTETHKVDDDFFNCPTQKLSTSKNIFPNTKICPSIHEEETQRPPEFSQFDKTNNIVTNDYSTNKHKDLTEVSEMNDDFFNCPTQKLSTTKNLNAKPKVSPSIHEEETQRPPEFLQFDKTNNIVTNDYSTNTHKDLTDVSEMDNDFFNCPTQKLSTTKKINPKSILSSSIHNKETKELLEFSKLCKSNSIVSKSCSTSIHEENSQIHKVDDDFFNCPTQKLSTSKNIFPNIKICPSIHEEETQRPPEHSQFDNTNNIVTNDCSTNKHKDLTEVPVMDDNFFNCPTLKVPCNSNSKFTMNCKKHESIPININETETNDSSKQSISKISLPSNIKQIKGNISVNSTSQKMLTKVQSKSISNCSVNIIEDVTKNHENFDRSSSHEKIVVPDNKDRCKVQKSKFSKSNIISQSNVQLPVMCNENSSNNLRTNKQKIRVRKDLHMSYSGGLSNNSTIILNKPNTNTVFDNINTAVPFNENFDLPGCSKTTVIKKNDLNASASKQKCFIDNSDQSQVSSISLRYNNNMKQINESTFSPLNIPDVSANSLLEDHSSPINIENNLHTLKCKSSTSSNNAFEWKSFWNKKKVQSRDKEKSDKQKSIKVVLEVKENKERYQTRAITRKRKQNGIVESNKKLCNRRSILEPLVENSSEIVVSFSYLKSRHLQEMKQFVEKTDVDDFIIVDKDAERKYKFKLKESLAKAKTKKLLDGYNVLVTPSVKPSPLEMKGSILLVMTLVDVAYN